MTPRTALLLLALATTSASAALFARRHVLQRDLTVIENAREAAAVAAGDALLTAEIDRIRLALERARSEPARTAEPHLALALTDGTLTLERGDIVLRTTVAEVDVPRGIHLVTAVAEESITLGDGLVLRPASATDDVLPPRTIRVPRGDFEAIRPNVRVGQTAYFF